MNRNRSLPAREVTVRIPEEAWRQFRGAVAQRDWDGDRLGNQSPEQSALAVGATAKMASVLLDDVDFGDKHFVINPDGSLEVDGKQRDESGRWLPGGDD